MVSNRENSRTWQGHGWLVVMALTVLAMLTVVQVGRVGRASGEQQLQAMMHGRTSANAEVLTRQLEDLRRDALFLKSLPPVDGLVRAAAHGGYDAAELTSGVLWEKRLTNIFRAYLQTHPDAFQVRLIGIANNARELIRVQREKDRITAAPSALLQDKGDTAYVRDGLALGADQAYLSDFNLNREHGALQVPTIPTVRAVAPVFGLDGKIFGLVVINYDLSRILRTMYGNLPGYSAAYLVNREGDFLLHPQESRRFSFERGQPWRWRDEFPGNATLSAGGDLQRLPNKRRDYFGSVRTIALDPLDRQRQLTYVLAVPQDQVYADVRRSQRDIALALAAGALIMGAAAYWQARQ